uniref:Uncharacterized protein n=1 Tax=Anguilla anguilla TaxID=7936 RepID=A0A0E9PIF0_ANGAN
MSPLWRTPGPVFQGFMDAGEILFQRPYLGVLLWSTVPHLVD